MTIIWCIEDVFEAAENIDVSITHKEARRVIELMKKGHDCNYGMTWEHIQSYILDVIEERNKQ